MPKPIRKTPEIIELMMKKFTEALEKASMYDGKITISQDFSWKGDKTRAKLIFSMKAWLKMLALIDDFSTEIGWHCTMDRVDETTFRIDDLLIYPQKVTGATVETDEDEWNKWIITDEYNAVCNRVFGHGHSHVRMGVTPSSVDNTHWQSILQNIRGESFYLFQIWNKNLDKTLKLYDFDNNTLYETADIDIEIEGMPFDRGEFLKLAHSRTVTSKYNYPAVDYDKYYGAYPGSSYSGAAASAQPKAKTQKKSEPKTKQKSALQEVIASQRYFDTKTGTWKSVDDWDELFNEE